MYALLLLGAITVAIGFVHVIVASTRSLIAMSIALLFTFAAGSISTQLQRSRAKAAISEAHPEEKLFLYARGYDEANRPIGLALSLVSVCIVPFVIGELRRARRQRD
jgi:hypothetical protein